MGTRRIIAERVYRRAGKRGTAKLTIGAPRLSADEPAWVCRFVVESEKEAHEGEAYGIDAVQALENVLASARKVLLGMGEGVQWLGGKGPGIAMTVPTMMGADFANELERYIELAVEKRVRELQRRHAGGGARDAPRLATGARRSKAK